MDAFQKKSARKEMAFKKHRGVATTPPPLVARRLRLLSNMFVRAALLRDDTCISLYAGLLRYTSGNIEAYGKGILSNRLTE